MKMSSAILVAVLLTLAAPPAGAQQWSETQREVMTAMEQCWDAWQQAVQAKQFGTWADRCLASAEVRFWWTEWSSPNTTRELERGMSRGLFTWGLTRWDWSALRPLAITIDGDMALVFVSSHWQREDTKGTVSFLENRRFEVWKRIQGQWKQLGGMAAPVGGGS